MHGAHPQKPQSTSLTHSLIHFPQERRRGDSFAAFSMFHVKHFPSGPQKKTRLPKTFPAFPRRDFPFPKPCGIIRKAENAGGALLQSEPGAPPESGVRGLLTASVVQYQGKSGKQRSVFRLFQPRGERLPAKQKQQETGRVSLWGKSLPSQTRRAVWEKPPRR